MKTNAEIQKDVIEELKWEPLLNASEIGVAVKDGIVTLSGTVDTYAKKAAAENAAYRVLGVKAVAEDIIVKPAGNGKKTDTEIAEAVLNALRWNSSIPDDKIQVKVENGWVKLEGTVEWEFQKKAVTSAITNLVGVNGISNFIRITPKASTSEVKSQINRAFHRSATIDASKINIRAHGSKVVLSGKVRSVAEKKDAENAAWSAPGVESVENLLTVEPEVYMLA